MRFYVDSTGENTVPMMRIEIAEEGADLPATVLLNIFENAALLIKNVTPSPETTTVEEAAGWFEGSYFKVGLTPEEQQEARALASLDEPVGDHVQFVAKWESQDTSMPLTQYLAMSPERDKPGQKAIEPGRHTKMRDYEWIGG